MTLEDFRSAEANRFPIGRLVKIISKNQTLYLNRRLEKFSINASQLHFLFEISHHGEMNQEKIASRCNINKGAVARSVKDLEDKGLVRREIDDKNRRQNKVSLTPKGEKTLIEAKKLLDEWENYVFDENIMEKELLQNALKEIAVRAIEFNEKGE